MCVWTPVHVCYDPQRTQSWLLGEPNFQQYVSGCRFSGAERRPACAVAERNCYALVTFRRHEMSTRRAGNIVRRMDLQQHRLKINIRILCTVVVLIYSGAALRFFLDHLEASVNAL